MADVGGEKFREGAHEVVQFGQARYTAGESEVRKVGANEGSMDRLCSNCVASTRRREFPLVLKK